MIIENKDFFSFYKMYILKKTFSCGKTKSVKLNKYLFDKL